MDLITHLPTSEGFDLVFIIFDKFSKYITFLPCKDTCTAPNLAGIFYNHIVFRFGMPIKVVSGMDSMFLFKFW